MAEVFQVAVDIDTSKLERLIDEYRERGEDLRDVAYQARAILKTAIDDIFYTEGTASAKGEKWKPSRRAIDQGGMTLNDTGILAGTLDMDSGEDWVSGGSAVPYGKYHLPPEKSGHDVTTGVMPVRDWLDVDEDAFLDDVGDLLVSHLAGD